jgi:hypothetical protein
MAPKGRHKSRGPRFVKICTPFSLQQELPIDDCRRLIFEVPERAIALPIINRQSSILSTAVPREGLAESGKAGWC